MSEDMRPRTVRHLRLYEEMRGYLRDFVDGHYPFLWLTAQTGVGKSEAILAAIGNRKVMYYKSGQLTPLALFKACHQNRDVPIVLDDVEHLLKDVIGYKLISALGDTSREKLLNWHSESGKLGAVPARFTTTSPLCIIANIGVNRAAIQSRALMLHFEPDNVEVHRMVACWFWDQEIHDWVGKRLGRLERIEARSYIHAANDKATLRDWQHHFREANAKDAVESLVQDLEVDPAYPTVKDRVRRFREILGSERGSRATYFRVKKRLTKAGRLKLDACIEVIPVQGKRPVRPQAEEATPTPPAADVPARDDFRQPIRGAGANGVAATPTRQVLDDVASHERTTNNEEDEENNP
jgi:hypothetical protein